MIKESKNLSSEEANTVLNALEDLEKKVELLSSKLAAQNRELEIEASLEKVRAAAMAMKQPADMLDVCRIISEQLQQLNVKEIRNVQTAVFYESKNIYLNYEYYTRYQKSFITEVEYKLHPDIEAFVNQMIKDSDGFFTRSFDRGELKDWLEYQKKSNQFVDPALNDADSLHYYFYSIGQGALGLSTYNIQLSEAELKLLKRFRNVFELANRRFIDIEQAIAQTKEAQIEAALEKVRGSAMAMHNSSDLSATTSLVFSELQKLGITSIRCGVVLLSENSRTALLYAAAASPGSDSLALIGSIEMLGHPVFDKQYEHWLKKENYFTVLDNEELNSYYKVLYSMLPVSYIPAEHQEKEYGYYFSFSEGLFYIWTLKPFTENEINILNRFKTLIDLTFRRYLDLQKAEAQGKEAQIEAALERVRSKTMGMQHSNELSETSFVLFQQLKELGEIGEQISIAIVNEQENMVYLYTTFHGNRWEHVRKFAIDLQVPVLRDIYYDWKAKKRSIVIDLSGEELNEYNSFRREKIGRVLDSGIDYSSERWTIHAAFFSQGMLTFSTRSPRPRETVQLLERFALVFDLAYRRFLDLRNSEAEAREAMRRASLDRVRAEIASMRVAEDLEHITPIIWRELKTLGIPFIRCGLFIVDREEKVRVFLSTPEGSSLGILTLPININEVTIEVVENWRKKNIYRVHWSKKEFIEWTKSMLETGQIQNSETYQGSANPPESLDLHFVPFCQGMLYVGSTSPLTDENIRLVQALSEAFSIAYARYEDFKNLEEAKSRIEAALNDLKSAQTQLIHSEKMASLGELTAGIAHEIKNPLNFVNNFSELSQELLDEMKIELENGSKERVLETINNLKRTLDKINHHGKRADSIIKGMLLHSRGGSGEKILTNVNDLLDQFVTLAYHGMRAQDKEFNVTIEKNYDESLEKINLVPQDISRVFLNVINNAFYAVNKKNKMSGKDYSPVLNVSTKNINHKVEIRIRDNGNGIPAYVKEQIFNPFFTTKPSGEGTGLGLSLSYDIIVKGHGGEIIYESEEGRFTEFIIILPC